MNTDPRWQQDLMTALHVESLFAVTAFPKAEWAETVKPTHAETIRAVTNIREWRTYLPESCVNVMIDDGWQWST